MTDYATRTELRELDERLRAEIAAARRDAATRDELLERRMVTIEGATLGMREQLGDIHDALFGDPTRRSGPPSLYERLDRMDAEIKAEIAAVSQDVRRWRTYEKGLMTVGQLLTALPMLKWLKAALAWLLTLAGGIGLGALVSTFLMWR